ARTSPSSTTIPVSTYDSSGARGDSRVVGVNRGGGGGAGRARSRTKMFRSLRTEYRSRKLGGRDDDDDDEDDDDPEAPDGCALCAGAWPAASSGTVSTPATS